MGSEKLPQKVYGKRLLPQILDDLAATTPHRLYASVPRDDNLDNGFIDISCADMARCANFMASWIQDRAGLSSDHGTVCYFGIPDLRMVPMFFGAVKCGYKVLLPSPRNPPSVNYSLMLQTGCRLIFFPEEVSPVVKQILTLNGSFKCFEIPVLSEMLDSKPNHISYDHEYETAKDSPIVVLHSSGSTGMPKPITMTHATFSVLDNERNLPKVPGRKNRDYSVWDFADGGRFYTVFPYYHLAGFLCLVINPTMTESSSPVLGPPLMPPSGSLLVDVMKHQKLKALYIPPSIAEQVLHDPGNLRVFETLDFLCYTGGPFSDAAGERLSKVTELCPLYGSTEAFQVPQLAPASPEDWAWMEWNPSIKLEMQPSDDGPGIYELVLFADSSTQDVSALNHNMPGTSLYRTKDLFRRHPDPNKSTLWKYHARRDDIIVLSNGEKFNPVPMELFIQGIPAIAGALVIGNRRSQAAIILEAKPTGSQMDRLQLPNMIWPYLEQGNLLIPAQGRIVRSNILVASPEKPFIRAGKGTIIRRVTEELYAQEIENLYETNRSSVKETPSLKLAVQKVFEIDKVEHFVRGIVIEAFPSAASASHEDDLFALGLDSVKVIQVVAHLKEEVKTHRVGDVSWINARTIFRARTLDTLAKVVLDFLNSGTVPFNDVTNARFAGIKECVSQGIASLPHLCIPRKSPSSSSRGRCVALIGSTGYLGPHVISALALSPDISRIVCLNRDETAKERTQEAIRHLPTSKSSENNVSLEYLTMNLKAIQLGLEDASYNDLLSKVDTIIYNSWRPDFSSPLSFFAPFLSGLDSVLKWATSSPLRPRIVFLSSTSAVGNWSSIYAETTYIPERVPPLIPSIPIGVGYGESKFVGEQVLAAAHEKLDLDIAIARIGQIGGPSRPGLGTWAEQKWISSIARTSKAMKLAPDNVAPIDWLAVDVVGTTIAKIVSQKSDEATGLQVFNLVHPKPSSWSVFLSAWSTGEKKVGLPQWLDRLEDMYGKSTIDIEYSPALKMLDFLRSLGEGREHNMKFETAKTMMVFGEDILPIDVGLMTEWLQPWKL